MSQQHQNQSQCKDMQNKGEDVCMSEFKKFTDWHFWSSPLSNDQPPPRHSDGQSQLSLNRKSIPLHRRYSQISCADDGGGDRALHAKYGPLWECSFTAWGTLLAIAAYNRPGHWSSRVGDMFSMLSSRCCSVWRTQFPPLTWSSLWTPAG